MQRQRVDRGGYHEEGCCILKGGPKGCGLNGLDWHVQPAVVRPFSRSAERWGNSMSLAVTPGLCIHIRNFWFIDGGQALMHCPISCTRLVVSFGWTTVCVGNWDGAQTSDGRVLRQPCTVWFSLRGHHQRQPGERRLVISRRSSPFRRCLGSYSSPDRPRPTHHWGSRKLYPHIHSLQLQASACCRTHKLVPVVMIQYCNILHVSACRISIHIHVKKAYPVNVLAQASALSGANAHAQERWIPKQVHT